MFNIFNKQPQQGVEIQFIIHGMHCTSCALTIDDELEEIEGVYSSATTYANSTTIVRYNPKKVTKQRLYLTVQKLGYQLEGI